MKAASFSPEVSNNAAAAASISERGIDKYGTYVEIMKKMKELREGEDRRQTDDRRESDARRAPVSKT